MVIKGTVPCALLLFIIITITVIGKGLKGISIILMQEWLYFTSSSSFSVSRSCECRILPKCLQVASGCLSVLITMSP